MSLLRSALDVLKGKSSRRNSSANLDVNVLKETLPVIAESDLNIIACDGTSSSPSRQRNHSYPRTDGSSDEDASHMTTHEGDVGSRSADVAVIAQLSSGTAAIDEECCSTCIDQSSEIAPPVMRCPFGYSSKDSSITSMVANLPVQPNRCPLGHGTVGNNSKDHARICKHGCVPSKTMRRDGDEKETWRDALIREAIEFQLLFSKERSVSSEDAAIRLDAILSSIATTGSYEHTYDELTVGSRIAWRNAPKCGNRKFYDGLEVVDARSAKTEEEMFDACLGLIEKASESFATSTSIMVFRPQTPGTNDGPRVWNTQLLRFACYRDENTPDRLIGDPGELGFSEMLQTEYDWKPPTPKSRFDILPLLLQAHSDGEPKLFPIPKHYAPIVSLSHPRFDWFAKLKLKWYAIPIVSAMDFTVGGLLYTAAPFNGWYSVTEIVRNLTDGCRYDLTKVIANMMGLNTKLETSLWRDLAMTELGVAVLHSFALSSYAITDHHTLMESFYEWYHKELSSRGYCPGNWKWIIPPMGASLSKCYLNLSHMQDYSLRPAYLYGAGWMKYRTMWLTNAKSKNTLPKIRNLKRSKTVSFFVAVLVMRFIYKVRGCLQKNPNTLLAKRRSSRCFEVASGMKVVLIYITVSGKAASTARSIYERLSGYCNISLYDAGTIPIEDIKREIESATLVLVVTSTAGSGDVPNSGGKLLRYLASAEESPSDRTTPTLYSVLGLGSSAYPKFCNAADIVTSAFSSNKNMDSLLDKMYKIDELNTPEATVLEWFQAVILELFLRRYLEDASYYELSDKASLEVKVELQESRLLFKHVQMEGIDPLSYYDMEKNRSLATVMKSAAIDGGDSHFTHLQLRLENTAEDTLADAGDELMVWAANTPIDVAMAAAGLGLVGPSLDKVITLSSEDQSIIDNLKIPCPQTYRVIFTHYLALNDVVNFEGIQHLSLCAESDVELKAAGKSFSTYLSTVASRAIKWKQVFSAFPSLYGRISITQFLNWVPLLRPRYYSVASVPTYVDGKLMFDMLAEIVHFKNSAGVEETGFCSGWLSTLKDCDRLAIKLVRKVAFRLPLNMAAPVVLIGAGSGVAPLRAMWQERAVRVANSLNTKNSEFVVLFGCRNKATTLFQSEMYSLKEDRIISSLNIALSREPGEKKMYCQDVIRENDYIRKVLANPKVHVIVCGSANMAAAVEDLILEVLGSRKDFNQMKKENRLKLDIFGQK